MADVPRPEPAVPPDAAPPAGRDARAARDPQPDEPPEGTPPPSTPADVARTPDEYTETPGSHRRPDGAATDVGA